MNQAAAPVERPIGTDKLIRRALSVKNSYGGAFVKTLLTTLFDAPKLMEISPDEIPQAYYLLEHIETLKGSHATLPEHVNILLHECPHTVWDTSSPRALETGMADLAGSLINTVAAMCALIESQRKEIEEISAKNDNLLQMTHEEHTKVQGLEYERDNTWLPKIAKYESAAGVERVLKGTTSMSLTMTPELEAELVKALSGQTQLMIVAQDHPKTFEEAWARFEAAGYLYGGGALENVRFGWRIAHGLKPGQRADDLATVNAARAMLAPAQLAPVKVAACAECSVAVKTLEGVEHYNMGCDACARRFEGDDSARLIKHVEPVAMPAVKVEGAPPETHPQLEHAAQEFPVVQLCPGCGIQETMGGQHHYNLECEACKVRQAAQEARAQGTPIHDLGDDVHGLIEMLHSGEWRPLQVKTHMGHKLVVALAELFNQAKNRRQLEVDIGRLIEELESEDWSGTASGSDAGKKLEACLLKVLNRPQKTYSHSDCPGAGTPKATPIPDMTDMDTVHPDVARLFRDLTAGIAVLEANAVTTHRNRPMEHMNRRELLCKALTAREAILAIYSKPVLFKVKGQFLHHIQWMGGLVDAINYLATGAVPTRPEHADSECIEDLLDGFTQGDGAPDDADSVICMLLEAGVRLPAAEKIMHALVDSHRLAFLEGRIKEKGAWGASLIFDAAHGGTFCYMHRHYRGAARKNLREVIDFERGINPTLPEFKEPK